jgi:hypothetical protein
MDGTEKLGYEFDLFRSRYKSTFRSDSTAGAGQPFLSNQNLWSYRESPIQGASSTLTMSFIYPLGVGDSQRYAEDWVITLESKEEARKINGISYSSVLVFRHNKEVSSNQAERTYYSKHVGIIRKELFNGEVWELKSHFINK